MEYDIFISYAHHDNATHGDWIAAFKKRLEADYRSRTGYALNIFFDQEDIPTGTVLSARLQQAIRSTRLFIPILTPAYLASRWCRQEFLLFLDAAGPTLVSGYRSRLMPVRLMPWQQFMPEATAKAEVEEVLGFLDGQEVLYLDAYRDPLPIEVEDPAFEHLIARLSKEIFLILNDREEEGEPAVATPPVPKAKPPANQGHLLYQIPDQMEVLQETRCRVRIAFEEQLLLEGIERAPGTEIRDIRVSEVMEVQLLDPAEEPAFAIRTFNRSEQFVETSAFTEWIFLVKPLREGKFPLLLRVTVIEQIGNKERAREIVLEEEVHIVADLDEDDMPVGTDAFRNAGVVVGADVPAPAPNMPPQANTRRNLARLATILSGILVLTVVGLNFLTRSSFEVESPGPGRGPAGIELEEVQESIDPGDPGKSNFFYMDSTAVDTLDTIDL